MAKDGGRFNLKGPRLPAVLHAAYECQCGVERESVSQGNPISPLKAVGMVRSIAQMAGSIRNFQTKSNQFLARAFSHRSRSPSSDGT